MTMLCLKNICLEVGCSKWESTFAQAFCKQLRQVACQANVNRTNANMLLLSVYNMLPDQGHSPYPFYTAITTVASIQVDNFSGISTGPQQTKLIKLAITWLNMQRFAKYLMQQLYEVCSAAPMQHLYVFNTYHCFDTFDKLLQTWHLY